MASVNSFINSDYFEQFSGLTLTPEEIINLDILIDSVLYVFESFCSRKLKARDFSYLVSPDDYSVFDGIKGNTFRFPTYPVNSITTFVIDSSTIVPATSYDDVNGYFLYKEKGQLIYSYGFSFGYNQNVKVVWNGGYEITHEAYSLLQNLTYLLVKKLWDDNSGDINPEILSETIGNYKYVKMSPQEMSKLFGLPVYIFQNLGRFKRMAIA